MSVYGHVSAFRTYKVSCKQRDSSGCWNPSAVVWNLGRNASGLWDVLTVAMGFHFTREDLRNIGALKYDPLMFGIKASQLCSTVMWIYLFSCRFNNL